MRTRRPRVGVRRPVRFYRSSELICAYTDDLSDRGAFVHTHAFLPVNGVVELCVTLERDVPTLIPARVAYCLPPEQARLLGRRAGIGFQFLHVDPEGGARLREYVRAARDEDAPQATPTRRRVLLACKHQRMEKRLTHALWPSGYTLGTAPTALLLLDELRGGCWDVVVLDEALGLAERLGHLAGDAECPLPPVLHVADHQDELARLRAYRGGVADCLQRPFTDEELRLRVAELLRRRRRKPTPDLAGTLVRMSAASVLALLEHERRSGELLLDCGAEAVQVSLQEGAISAVDGRLQPGSRHQLLAALRWREGHFEFRVGKPSASATDSWPVSGVLLDCARIEDEDRASRP